LPHRSVLAGCLDCCFLIAILFPPWFEMKVALTQEAESQRTFQGGDMDGKRRALHLSLAGGVTARGGAIAAFRPSP
jgi:hypothetical protein